MPAFDVARRWKGRVVLDRSGDKLGSVLDVFYDAENDEPGWVLLGVAGAGGHGNELRVPYDRAFVEAAPGMAPGGRLWPQEEAELYAYYALPYTGASLVDEDEDEDEDETTPRSPSSGAGRRRSDRGPRTPACGS